MESKVLVVSAFNSEVLLFGEPSALLGDLSCPFTIEVLSLLDGFGAHLAMRMVLCRLGLSTGEHLAARLLCRGQLKGAVGLEHGLVLALLLFEKALLVLALLHDEGLLVLDKLLESPR